jgi:hypothetical protein
MNPETTSLTMFQTVAGSLKATHTVPAFVTWMSVEGNWTNQVNQN